MVKVLFYPHFSYFEEVDVTELEALRQALNSRGEDGPKLTYLPFIMLTLAKIMPEHPECNGYFYDEEGVVHRHEAVNLGIATQTDGAIRTSSQECRGHGRMASVSDLIRVSEAAEQGQLVLMT